jgi:hypothetical protein
MAELQALLLTAGLFGFVVAGVVEFVATMIVFHTRSEERPH